MLAWLALGAAVTGGAGCGATPPAPERRSILLVTVDTLRWDHVRRDIAPRLAALADEGVRFEQAVTVAPLTLPAHGSLFTGQFPPAHGLRDNHLFALPAGTPTYVTLLRDAGWATGAFVSAVVLDARYGLDAGFDIYDAGIDGPERPAPETLAHALEWVRAAPRPFFLWVHLFEPHAPYLTGSYAGEVTAADTALGTFFDRLRTTGLWDDLVVSVTSDHGESLGEHGERTHGFFVYDATIRIPWLLKAPGLRPAVFAPQVRITDVMPTMLGLAGFDPAVRERFERGRPAIDLGRYLDGRLDPALEAYAESFLPQHQFGWSPLRSVRTARHKLIEAPRPELYDLRADPAEGDNRFEAEGETAERLRRLLAAMAAEGPTAARVAADPAHAERLFSLGYVGPAGPPQGAAALADPKDKLEVYELTMAAIEHSEQGRPAAALQALDRAARLDPDVAQVHFLRGSILGRLDRYADAAAALRKAVEQSPGHTTAQFKLALALLRTGDHAAAEESLRNVVRDEPGNVRAWHNLAVVAYARGDLEGAEAHERRALAIDPKYVEGWNALGAIHLMRKQPELAIQALETAVRLDRRNAQALANLALALRAAGRHADAKARAAEACGLDARYCG